MGKLDPYGHVALVSYFTYECETENSIFTRNVFRKRSRQRNLETSFQLPTSDLHNIVGLGFAQSLIYQVRFIIKCIGC